MAKERKEEKPPHKQPVKTTRYKGSKAVLSDCMRRYVYRALIFQSIPQDHGNHQDYRSRDEHNKSGKQGHQYT